MMIAGFASVLPFVEIDTDTASRFVHLDIYVVRRHGRTQLSAFHSKAPLARSYAPAR
jgi:hypothetical protein